jgi:hypothetical protein
VPFGQAVPAPAALKCPAARPALLSAPFEAFASERMRKTMPQALTGTFASLHSISLWLLGKQFERNGMLRPSDPEFASVDSNQELISQEKRLRSKKFD